MYLQNDESMLKQPRFFTIFLRWLFTEEVTCREDLSSQWYLQMEFKYECSNVKLSHSVKCTYVPKSFASQPKTVYARLIFFKKKFFYILYGTYPSNPVHRINQDSLLFLQGSVRPVEQKVEYFNGNRCPIWYNLPRNIVFNIFDREYLYGDFNRP